MHAVTELSLITMHWFLTMFASVVHTRILLRLWDLFFYEGSTVLFQVTLGMLKMKVCVFSHCCKLSAPYHVQCEVNHFLFSQAVCYVLFQLFKS